MLRLIALAAATLLPAATAMAEVVVSDPFMRVSRPGAPTGAAFMMLTNTGTEPVQFIGAESDIAPRVMLHTHIDDGDGVMKMRHVDGGFAIPAGGTLMLKRGGHHVMFMGLSETFETGQTIPLTLTFEGAASVTLDVPVDNERVDLHSDH